MGEIIYDYGWRKSWDSSTVPLLGIIYGWVWRRSDDTLLLYQKKYINVVGEELPLDFVPVSL